MKQKEGAKKPFSVLCAVALVASLCLPTAALADVGASDQAQGANSAASAGQVADAQAAAGDAADANAADAADAAEPAKQAADGEALAAEPAVQSDNEGAAVQAEGVAAIGDTQYVTLQAAIDAAKDGDTIKLLADVGQTSNVLVKSSSSISLDLNGYNVNLKSSQIRVEGILTLSDTTAKVAPTTSDNKTVSYKSGKIVADQLQAVVLYNGGRLTVKSGTVESLGDCAIYAGDKNFKTAGSVVIDGGYIHGREFGIGAMTGSSVTVNDGIILADDNAALAGNGSSGLGNTTMTVNGGTIIGNIISAGYIACGIYHPQQGSLYINGGTIVANNGVGVLMRAGNATISGGEILATGNVSGGVGDKKQAVPSAALVYDVAPALYPGYQGGNKVSVTGGKFSSVSDAGSVATLGDEAVPFALAGGNFSSCPDPAYIADGYVATAAKDKTYDVLKASASAGEGSATGSAAVAPSEVKPKLSDDSAKALASTAGKTAESLLKKNKQLPDNVKVDNADLDTINGISIQPEDKVSVTFVVDAQPVEKSDDAIAEAKKSNENQYDIDVSVRMLIAVNDTASAIAKVTELPEDMQITVTVDPSFIKDKNVRIARNHDGKVDFITPTKVDYATGEITFTTNLFSSYAVLASDKPAPTPVVTHAVSFVDKFNNVTNVADVEDGQAVAQPKDPSFDGYEFVGWFTDEAAQNKYDFSTPVKGDLTLYAGYKKVEQPANNNGSDKGDNGSTADKPANTAEAPAATALAQTGDNVVPIALGAVALGALLIAAGALVLRRRSQR